LKHSQPDEVLVVADELARPASQVSRPSQLLEALVAAVEPAKLALQAIASP